MDTRNELHARQEELVQAVEHQIAQRTWGRVQQLRIALEEERLLVEGYTTSYYAKQLAIQAVLDVLATEPGLRPVITIQVSESVAIAAHRREAHLAGVI